MVFTSYAFAFVFLPIVLLLHVAARGYWRIVLFVASSYVFYGFWRLDYLSLLIAITAVGYVGGRLMGLPGSAPSSRRKAVLLLSLCAALALLGIFKYADFAVANVNSILGLFGGASLELPGLLLPVGISFFTFHVVSYLVDVYRGDVSPEPDAGVFAAYVALFPQLVAGPIVRYREVAHRFDRPLRGTRPFAIGVLFFMIGFAKKVLIANNLAPMSDAVFEADSPGGLASWVGALSYTLQLYFDFSGYSDMAIGLGLMIGFRYPRNFDRPYIAASITEFWQRWHMTLSRFLRDYLYIPLGGNRGGTAKTVRNLMLTMVLGGLWHGAAWTYVLWGAFHGALLALERTFPARDAVRLHVPRALRVLVTFCLVLFGWVIFRSPTVEHAMGMWQAMLGIGSGEALSAFPMGPQFWIVLAASSLLIWLAPPSHRIAALNRPLLHGVAVVAFYVAVLELFSQAFSPFLYFQF